MQKIPQKQAGVLQSAASSLLPLMLLSVAEEGLLIRTESQ